MKARKRSLPVFPIVMIVFGVGLIIGSIFWVANTGKPDVTIVPTVPNVRIPYPDITRITVQDAKDAFDSNSAIFIDTRGEPYYSQGHIPGAVPITEEELSARLEEFDRTALIITYCT